LTVENISISVKTNADKAATKINALSLALERLENTARSAQTANTATSSAMGNLTVSAQRAQSASSRAAKGIEEVAKSAKKAESPLGNFVASLKRIAFYRMLRTIIKEIASALKEGLENVYEWSKAGGDMGRIASALDHISSASAQMKNQLGAAFGELLAALEPVIVTLINLITELAQALTWVISLLSGQGYYPVAKEITKDWKEAKDAAGAYKNTILGFDEINRLNDTGGGGGTTGIGADAFDWEPIEFGLEDLFGKTYEWLSKLKDEVDKGTGAIGDLLAELLGLPELVDVKIKVTEEVPEPLLGSIRPILESSPFLVALKFALTGNPLPAIQAIRGKILELIDLSPVEIFVRTLVEDPQPQIDTIVDALASMVTSVQEAYTEMATAASAWASSFWDTVGEYQEASGALQTENSTLGQDVVDTFNRMKNPLNDWVSHAWQKVEEYQQASGALQIENETLESDVATTYGNIKTWIKEALDNAKDNFNTFTTVTLPSWVDWAEGVADTVASAFSSVAESVYQGLTNAGENIASWLSTTASSVWSWASGTLRSIGNWASGIATNVASALGSAWESFKEFMGATNQTVSGFFSDHPILKTLIFGVEQPQTSFPSVTLAPAWMGGAMPIPAFADGGMIPNTSGTLFLAGEAGAEIVANMGSKTGVMNVDQMEAAVANGNMSVVNAVYAMANMIVRAIDDKDFDVELDGESVANKLYRPMQNAANRYGTAMVT